MSAHPEAARAHARLRAIAACALLTAAGAPLRGSGVAWAVSVYFGVQSMAFYASLSWIPSILGDSGWSSEAAGGLLALGALIGLVPAFLVPVAAARARRQLWLLAAIVLVPAAGLVGILATPGAVHDASGGWTVPLVVLIAITLAELVPGIPAARARTIPREA